MACFSIIPAVELKNVEKSPLASYKFLVQVFFHQSVATARSSLWMCSPSLEKGT